MLVATVIVPFLGFFAVHGLVCPRGVTGVLIHDAQALASALSVAVITFLLMVVLTVLVFRRGSGFASARTVNARPLFRILVTLLALFCLTIAVAFVISAILDREPGWWAASVCCFAMFALLIAGVVKGKWGPRKEQ